jgi:8-oxo-dGTP pyrophosphatase MutT (NUDIX family)
MARLQRPIVCVVVVRDALVLLQRRTKSVDDTPYRGLWELPQGKIEKGESLQQAARRELKEETGLDVSEVLSGQVLEATQFGPHSRLSAIRPALCVQGLGKVADQIVRSASGRRLCAA